MARDEAEKPTVDDGPLYASHALNGTIDSRFGYAQHSNAWVERHATEVHRSIRVVPIES
jgi:hypothetical protein